jgi:hypothetical protein
MIRPEYQYTALDDLDDYTQFYTGDSQGKIPVFELPIIVHDDGNVGGNH